MLSLKSLFPRKGSFGADTLILASGSIIAQVITVAASPILTRLYRPTDFGLMATFLSINSIMVVIACLRYNLSIVLPKSDKEAINLLGVSTIFVVIITFINMVIIWCIKDPLLNLLNARQINQFAWLIPVAVFFGGNFMSLSFWESRNKRFARLSLANILNSVTFISIQLIAGFWGYATAGSLIVGYIIGSVVSSLYLIINLLLKEWPLLLDSLNWSMMWDGFKRHRKFAIFDTWSALLNTLSWQLPVFLLTGFFSPSVAGYYALGDRVLRSPMQFISNSIGQVFFQRAADAKNNGALSVAIESPFKRLVMFGLFPMLLLSLVGRDFVEIIFGKPWIEAGVYLQILSIWTFFWFISSPLSTLFRVLERQEFSLIINIIIIVTRFLSLGIGAYYKNARLAITLFAISGVFVYGYYSLAIVAAAGMSWSKMMRIILAYFIMFLPAGVIIIILKILDINSLIQVVTAGIMLVVYFMIVAIKDSNFKKLALQN